MNAFDNGCESTNPKDKLGVKKVPLQLVPAVSTLHEALAFLDGALKYGPANWREKKVSASVYIAACKRHLDHWYDARERCATDSGVHHLGHAKACLGIILDAEACGALVDDRPAPGGLADASEEAELVVKALLDAAAAREAAVMKGLAGDIPGWVGENPASS